MAVVSAFTIQKNAVISGTLLIGISAGGVDLRSLPS